MTRVYLARHGETEWNAQGKYLGLTNLSLTSNGESQARALSSFLANKQIDIAYSSALIRANQTAKIVTEPHGLNVCKVPGLNEVDFGEWDGLTYPEIKERYPGLADDWLKRTSEVQIPGGESWLDFKTRVMGALNEILNKNGGKNILVVSHGGPIKTIISDILGLELTSFWKITQDRGALNIIEFYGEEGVITLLNGTYY